MKRKYEKPMLLREEFSLENTIAACAVKNPQPSVPEQCSYQIDGLLFPVFAEKWASCTLDNKYYNGCLYDGPNTLFSS